MASGVPDCWQQGANGHGDSERRRAHAVALEGADLTRYQEGNAARQVLIGYGAEPRMQCSGDQLVDQVSLRHPLEQVAAGAMPVDRAVMEL